MTNFSSQLLSEAEKSCFMICKEGLYCFFWPNIAVCLHYCQIRFVGHRMRIPVQLLSMSRLSRPVLFSSFFLFFYFSSLNNHRNTRELGAAALMGAIHSCFRDTSSWLHLNQQPCFSFSLTAWLLESSIPMVLAEGMMLLWPEEHLQTFVWWTNLLINRDLRLSISLQEKQ